MGDELAGCGWHVRDAVRWDLKRRCGAWVGEAELQRMLAWGC